jgi:hypothetical protein
MGTLIAPLSNPRPLSRRPLPLQSLICGLRLSKVNDKEEGDFPVRETRGKGYLLTSINDF